MPVTDRPLPQSPWAQSQMAPARILMPTNGLIAIAFAAMVAVSTIYLLINGAN